MLQSKLMLFVYEEKSAAVKLPVHVPPAGFDRSGTKREN